MGRYIVRSPADLQSACAAAQAGDEILIHGGLYAKPSVMEARSGTTGCPIIFRAADDQWISGGQLPNPFWSESLPSQDAPGKPGITDFAFLVIDECTNVVIDGLRIQNCWPSILFVKDTRFLQVRNCVLRHGTYAIFAKGNTSHLLIEDNEWQQDDSPCHDLWLTLEWERAHGNEGSDGLYRYFNGGFLSSKGISGKVVVRRNRIMDAFNGVRMKSTEHPPSVEDIRRLNADVYIVDNDFIRIRDNPTEPEVSAYNWHVRHNRLLDCHAWFSFDGVTGGYWYFYGNTGYFQSRQGPPNTSGHTMGRVLKLSYEQRPPDPESEGVPVAPWFVFNNSWHLRCPIIGGKSPTVPPAGEGPDFTAHLDFFNNAFDWCDGTHYGSWLCEPIDLMYNFDFGKSTGSRFDYDLCSRPDFLNFFAGRGEEHGLLATRQIFEDASLGRFALSNGSEALRSGLVRGVERPDRSTAIIRAQADGTLNRGAVQDYGLIQVPDLEAEISALITEIVTT